MYVLGVQLNQPKSNGMNHQLTSCIFMVRLNERSYSSEDHLLLTLALTSGRLSGILLDDNQCVGGKRLIRGYIGNRHFDYSEKSECTCWYGVDIPARYVPTNIYIYIYI